MTTNDYNKLVARIDNWFRAMKQGYRFGRCGSAEGFYRASNVNNEDSKDAIVLIDLADAEVLEKAWRTMPTMWAKWMIKWHFVEHFPRHAIQRRLQRQHRRAFPLDQYSRELYVAAELLQKNIDFHKAKSHSATQQFNSSPVLCIGRQ